MQIPKAPLTDYIKSHPGIARSLNATPGFGAVILSK